MKLRIRVLKQADIAKYLICDQSLYSKYERSERSIPVELTNESEAYKRDK